MVGDRSGRPAGSGNIALAGVTVGEIIQIVQIVQVVRRPIPVSEVDLFHTACGREAVPSVVLVIALVGAQCAKVVPASELVSLIVAVGLELKKGFRVNSTMWMMA